MNEQTGRTISSVCIRILLHKGFRNPLMGAEAGGRKFDNELAIYRIIISLHKLLLNYEKK